MPQRMKKSWQRDMKKGKDVKLVDSREAEVDLTMEMTNLIIFCKKTTILNGKMKIKARNNGKVVIPTELEIIPTKEEVILTLEVDFMVNVIDVVVKVIDLFNVKVMVRMLV